MSPDNGQDTPDREDFMNWNCKYCGLPIREYENISTGYIHLSSINNSEMVTCRYANSKSGTIPSSVIRAKYPVDKCNAMPEGMEDVKLVSVFKAGSLVQNPAPEQVNRIVINVLPEVKGRRFR